MNMDMENILKQIEQDFKIIGYLNQYREEGIYFVFNNEIQNPVSDEDKKDLDLSDKAHIISYETNTDVDVEMTQRFCQRRWEEVDKTKNFSIKRFLNKEIEFIEHLLESYTDEYDSKLEPVLRILKKWRFKRVK